MITPFKTDTEDEGLPSGASAVTGGEAMRSSFMEVVAGMLVAAMLAQDRPLRVEELPPYPPRR